MTPKQRAFVYEYVIDLNAAKAAVRAGYSERTARSIGSTLLTKDNIQQAVRAAMAEKAARAGRAAADVLRDIIGATARARQAGDLKHEFRGLELEGRHYGMFTDKFEHRLEVSAMSDEELDAEIERLERKRGNPG